MKSNNVQLSPHCGQDRAGPETHGSRERRAAPDPSRRQQPKSTARPPETRPEPATPADGSLAQAGPAAGEAYSPPPIHPAEDERLEDLYSLKILDTSAEEKFDQYTRLLADLLDVPYALISLVDRDRQWFKSAYGIDVSETPRDISFCGHAINQQGIFIVPDALQDNRFSGNPLVRGDPRIRFYAGAVLKGPAGHQVGTCCVIDDKPRRLDKREKRLLAQLGRIVEQELHTAHQVRTLREQLQKTAFFDPLTGLPDRKLFLDRLGILVKDAEKNSRQLFFSLIRFDEYDQFEGIFGRQEASTSIAQFRARLIEASGPQAYVGRWQDDTLSLVVPLHQPELDALHTMERVARELNQPAKIAGKSQVFATSLGACIYPVAATDVHELTENALKTLQTIPPHDGDGANYRFYTPRLNSAAARGFQIEHGLREAVRNDELHLVFQPKAKLKDGRIGGAEALLRWDSPSLGRVSPGEFFPVAEQSGLGVDLGNAVLEKACRQCVEWKDQKLKLLPLSVNISSGQLREPGFYEHLTEILQDTGLPPYLLKLEITEGSLIEDIEGAIQIMKRLKRLGVKFSIDDFGTGFSSLNYLGKMPLDELKIDKSFVDKLTVKQESASVVQGLIMLAHSIGMKVVAEGVETPEQLIFLRAYKCDEIQGYLFSPPVQSSEYAGMLRQNRKL